MAFVGKRRGRATSPASLTGRGDLCRRGRYINAAYDAAATVDEAVHIKSVAYSGCIYTLYKNWCMISAIRTKGHGVVVRRISP